MSQISQKLEEVIYENIVNSYANYSIENMLMKKMIKTEEGKKILKSLISEQVQSFDFLPDIDKIGQFKKSPNKDKIIFKSAENDINNYVINFNEFIISKNSSKNYNLNICYFFKDSTLIFSDNFENGNFLLKDKYNNDFFDSAKTYLNSTIINFASTQLAQSQERMLNLDFMKEVKKIAESNDEDIRDAFLNSLKQTNPISIKIFCSRYKENLDLLNLKKDIDMSSLTNLLNIQQNLDKIKTKGLKND